MKSKRILDILGQVNEEYIEEATPGKPQDKKHPWVQWGAVAAAFVLIVAILLSSQNREFLLSDASKNVQVSHIKKVPYGVGLGKQDLVWLTEEELFSKYSTVVFKGSVKRIDNIVIKFNGDDDYRAIAEIKVQKVYRGNIHSGETLSVLLPCPMDKNYQWEDTGIISQLQVGSTGIFTPVEYDEGSIWEQNGATLALKDIAEYGFLDGRRYVFLETERGLVFAREAYASISDATTLKEVEEYILKMIN